MTQSGFWRNIRDDNRRVMLGDHAYGVNRIFYLFPQGGGPSGSFTFSTFADMAPHLRDRDLVLLSGVLREQAIAPVVYDVTILGAANQPRQATSGGVPTGGGASWLAPTSPVAATPLLQIVAQGWVIENIQFAPVAASDCIRFRRMETAAIPDASHGIVRGCYFSTGGAAGHGVNLGECKRIVVEDCEFEALTGAGGTAIRRSADGGISNTNYCTIQRNKFVGNANDIILASAENIVVRDNIFMDVVDGARKFIQVTGANLYSLNNYLSQVATAGYTVANGFEGGATDTWRIFVNDAVDPIVVVPA